MINVEGAPFVVLRGIKEGNVFWTSSQKGEDPTKLATGEVAYELIGYANSDVEAKSLYQKHCGPDNLFNFVINTHKAINGGNFDRSSIEGQLIEEMAYNLEHKGAELKNTDHVHVQVVVQESIPVDSNPFHYDLMRMGTELVRGWTVMHPGFDRKEDPRPLDHLVLCNSRSGQRIRLDFKPIYEYRNLKLANPAYYIDGGDKLSNNFGNLESCTDIDDARQRLGIMLGYHWQFVDLRILKNT